MNKITNRITVLLFVAVLFGLMLTFFILPDQAFSAQENRSLRTFPKFTWEKLASGEFSEQINDYFADQFPIRDLFVGVKGVSELALGKGENDGVLLGKDGQLAKRLFDAADEEGKLQNTDAFDPAHVKRAIEAVNAYAKASKVPFSVLLTGRTIDVTATDFAYPTDQSDALWATVNGALDPNVSRVETLELLRERHAAGEEVYYKTDHHWTTQGAYYAYVQTMKSFGMEDEILPASAFAHEVVSTSFYGTAWSAGGMKFVDPDRVEFWFLGNEDEFTVTADGRPQASGMYNRDYLQKKDHYSAFLDGTHDVVTVTKAGEGDRPTLLLLKDSFANALAPFLAQHFDLVLLNLSSTRTDFTDLSKYAAEYGADRILLVYTVENVVIADRLEKLR